MSRAKKVIKILFLVSGLTMIPLILMKYYHLFTQVNTEPNKYIETDIQFVNAWKSFIEKQLMLIRGVQRATVEMSIPQSRDEELQMIVGLDVIDLGGDGKKKIFRAVKEVLVLSTIFPVPGNNIYIYDKNTGIPFEVVF